MLELPGLTSSGDLGKDLDGLKRYIARLVPALEMELISANQDDYQNEYNAQTKGIGNANKTNTAGALVAHELRKDNPHKVTAGQLGLSLDKLVTVSFNRDTEGFMVRIGEKRGLQINVQMTNVEISVWHVIGEMAYADADLGEWEQPIPILYAAVPVLRTGSERDCWAGQMDGSSGEQIGTLRFYLPEIGVLIDEEDTDFEAQRNIPLTVVGLGVFGYGEQ